MSIERPVLTKRLNKTTRIVHTDPESNNQPWPGVYRIDDELVRVLDERIGINGLSFRPIIRGWRHTERAEHEVGAEMVRE